MFFLMPRADLSGIALTPAEQQWFDGWQTKRRARQANAPVRDRQRLTLHERRIAYRHQCGLPTRRECWCDRCPDCRRECAFAVRCERTTAWRRNARTNRWDGLDELIPVCRISWDWTSRWIARRMEADTDPA